MKKQHLVALATTALIAISGVGAASAQTTTHFPLSPMSVANAVRSAEEYLSVDGFSRQGLVRQLVSIDGYSTEDATAAVDSIAVNWNEQAAKSAKQYLSVDGFSHSGLVTQLVSIDGYTPAQAEYGVEEAGL